MRTNTAFVASLVGAATALPLLGNEHRVESVNGLANNVDSLVGSKGLASDLHLKRGLTGGKLPIIGDLGLVDEDEKLIDESELPVKESELPVKESELPVDESELPVDENELPIDEDEFPVEGVFGNELLETRSDVSSGLSSVPLIGPLLGMTKRGLDAIVKRQNLPRISSSLTKDLDIEKTTGELTGLLGQRGVESIAAPLGKGLPLGGFKGANGGLLGKRQLGEVTKVLPLGALTGLTGALGKRQLGGVTKALPLGALSGLTGALGKRDVTGLTNVLPVVKTLTGSLGKRQLSTVTQLLPMSAVAGLANSIGKREDAVAGLAKNLPALLVGGLVPIKRDTPISGLTGTLGGPLNSLLAGTGVASRDVSMDCVKDAAGQCAEKPVVSEVEEVVPQLESNNLVDTVGDRLNLGSL